MAAIALGVGAAAYGASAGLASGVAAALTAVATAVGAYVDSQFLLPALFPKDPIEGPRLNQLAIQSNDEGAPGNIALGGYVPTAGAIIWVSELIEKQSDATAGGKGGHGGGSTPTIAYEYYVSVAVAVHFGPITSIRKILAEGKLIYEDQPDKSFVGNVFSAGFEFPASPYGLIKITSSDPTKNLTTLRVGTDVTVAGFANGANNGTWKCVSTSYNHATGASSCILNHNGPFLEAAGPTVTITQHPSKFEPSTIKGVTIYLGTSGQGVDPLMDAYEGAGNVPAYVNTAYFVLEELHLKDFGNRIPQFKVVLQGSVGGTVGSAIQEIMIRAGRTSGDLSAPTLTETLQGMGISGPQVMSQVLQPLMLAYDVLPQETNGVINFFHRREARIIDVDENDIIVRTDDAEAPQPIFVEDVNDTKIPSRVNVDYLDIYTEEQRGSQTERRINFLTDGVMSVDLTSIVMAGTDARAIARRILYSSWANRQPVRVWLPPSYYAVQENDILRFYALGQYWTLLVQKVDIGLNWRMEIETIVELRSVLTQDGVADTPRGFQPSIMWAPAFLVSTVHGVTSVGTANSVGSNNPTPRLIVGAHHRNSNGTWTGASIFGRYDSEDYRVMGIVAYESFLGAASTALPSGPVGVWDHVSTVDVCLSFGTLESHTELDVLNGLNRALLGDEIIGWKTATLKGVGVYTLSDLLRGLKGTDDQVGTHIVGEDFIFLTGPQIAQLELNPAAIGRTLSLKIVGAGQDIDDVDAQTIVVDGKSLQTLAPTDIHGTRNTDGDVAITWKRQTRAVTRLFAPAYVPLCETTEAYEIDIYKVDGTTFLRTLSASSPTVTYTAAMAVADGTVAFDTIVAKVYQMSELLGRGKRGTATI